MNPDQHEADWLAKATKRNYEYSKLAYEHLSKKEPTETDLNNAKLYLANIIGSCENLYDFYATDEITKTSFDVEETKARSKVARWFLGDN